MPEYRGWTIELLETGDGWRFVARKPSAAGGEVDRLESLSPYRSQDEALAEARDKIDREPWRGKP